MHWNTNSNRNRQPDVHVLSTVSLIVQGRLQ